MKRNLERLSRAEHDVAIIGGGVLGAFIAWDAAARGLRAALVERGDFGGGTTAASGKVMHGGLRFLRTGNIGLALEARREQATLRRLAPGLLRPMPFLVPAPPGGAWREAAELRAAAAAWRGFCRWTRSGTDLPAARFLAGAEVADLEPRLAGSARRGALLYHDDQLRYPERLTLAVLHEANRFGAAVANHVEATGLIEDAGRVRGLWVRDRLAGESLEVRARVVVNAAGVWAPRLLGAMGLPPVPVAFARGLHAVTDRPAGRCAVVVPWRDPGAGGGRAAERRVFLMPWEGLTLIGATYAAYEGDPAACAPAPDEAGSFVAALADRWPELEVAEGRLRFAYAGLYPIFGRRRAAVAGFDASRKPLVLRHDRRGGPAGLFTAIGVKLTTARALAERVVDQVVEAAGLRAAPCRTAVAGPLPRARAWPVAVEPDAAEPDPRDPAARDAMVAAAVDEEMASTLADLVFRRTPLGQRGELEPALLGALAQAMAARLGWSPVRTADEIAAASATAAGSTADAVHSAG